MDTTHNFNAIFKGLFIPRACFLPLRLCTCLRNHLTGIQACAKLGVVHSALFNYSAPPPTAEIFFNLHHFHMTTLILPVLESLDICK